MQQTTTRGKFFSAFCLFCPQGQNALDTKTSTITYIATRTIKTDADISYYKINSTKKILYKSDTSEHIKLPSMEIPSIKKDIYNYDGQIPANCHK